jgi:hypothetical protein
VRSPAQTAALPQALAGRPTAEQATVDSKAEVSAEPRRRPLRPQSDRLHGEGVHDCFRGGGRNDPATPSTTEQVLAAALARTEDGD